MRTLLLCLAFFIPAAIYSQHYHFIYIQGDNQQVFYIKKSGEVLSSSATGFLILPKLPSGTHQFIVGFPRNQWPEYEYQVEVKNTDRGFVLKNMGEKGWILTDLQTQEQIPGKRIEAPREAVVPETPKSNDPFSVILASAVGDPGIRETSLVMVSTRPMPVASRGSTAPRTVPQQGTPPAANTEKVLSSPPAAPPTASVDTKPPVLSTTTSDISIAKADSKHVELPLVKGDEKVPGKEPEKAEMSQKGSTDSMVTAQKETVQPMPAEEVKKVADAAPAVASITLPEVKTPSAAVEVKPANSIRKISEVRGWKSMELIYLDQQGGQVDTVTVIIDDLDTTSSVKAAEGTKEAEMAKPSTRTDCKAMGSEKDMMVLRKKVLRQNNEADMVELTMKELRSRCYTVEMLQNMSFVLVTDASRYRLFEEAYPHIYDPLNYGKLERLLTSEEYLTRFRNFLKSR